MPKLLLVIAAIVIIGESRAGVEELVYPGGLEQELLRLVEVAVESRPTDWVRTHSEEIEWTELGGRRQRRFRVQTFGLQVLGQQNEVLSIPRSEAGRASG